MLTLRQFEDAARLRAMTDYGTSAEEYNAAYPTGSRAAEWLEDLRTRARKGETPSRFVERSLRTNCPQDAERILHHLRLDAEQAAAQ